ncbi:MAG TPA: tetratricopeptide repeat protein [Polyangiaceae bacterium]|nr:tetratricopeptide repeat protein [Polyangiaceae bacterium]
MSRVPNQPPAPTGPDAARGALDAPFRLRLAVSRHGVGLELDGPAQLGPLRVDELVWALPSVRMPADLSGGVSVFRHRRGRLTRASVSGSAEELCRWAQARLVEAALLGRAQRPSLSLLTAEGGLGLCLSSDEQALAWDIAWLPSGRDVRLVVHNARGLGLALPAHALALQASAALVREGAVTRRGSLFTLNDPASRIVRYLLPWVGARVPSTEELVWAALAGGGRWSASASARGLEPSPPTSAALALEVALLLGEADDALAEGQWDEARQGYLRALERAPHQREVALRLADVDRALGRHAELAFATMADAGALGGASCLEGELRRACGDAEGAGVVFEAAAGGEPQAALAALAFAAAAELAPSEGQAAALLAAAVARAPTHLGVRQRRLAWGLRMGDRRAALAEAERLVAATELSVRHVRLLEVGRAFAAAGRGDEAVEFFEQALRLRPEAPDVLLALGEALAERGQAARAVELLRRALEGAERAGLPLHGADVALARALAEGLGELSTAVARLRHVPAGAPESAEARWLEGYYLARLGDRAEASLAFARMREELRRGALEAPGQAAERLAWVEAYEAAVWSGEEAALPTFAGEGAASGAAGPAGVEDGAGEHTSPGAAASAGEGAPPSAASNEVAPASFDATEAALPPSFDAAGVAARDDDALAPDDSVEAAASPSDAPAEADEGVLADEVTAEGDEGAPGDEVTAEGDEGSQGDEGQVEDDGAPWPPDAGGEVGEAAFDEARGEAGEAAAFDEGGGEAGEAAAFDEGGGEAGGAPSPSLGAHDDEGGPPPAVRRALPRVDEETLTARVRANPDDLEAVEALATLFEASDRDAELFALISARMDEGDERTRRALAPRRRAVLERLARQARDAGRTAEAELYELTLGATGG